MRALTRARRILAVGCVISIALFWGIALERVSYEREEALNDLERGNMNLALAFEEHTLRTLKAIDQVLRFIQYEHERTGGDIDLGLMAATGAIDDSISTAVGIVDDQGDVTHLAGAPVPANVSDRAYFQFHRARQDGGLHIGVPVLGRISGREAFHLTRRIDKADGSFAGVALVAVDPSYFSRFYRQVDVRRDGQILLVGTDGIVRACQAGGATSAGRDIRDSPLFRKLADRSAGSFVAAGRLDGVQRYTSYRTVPGYPLVVAVGASVDEALAEFNGRARNYCLAAALATLLVGILGGGLTRQLGKRRQAIERMAASDARYRAAFEQAAIGVTHTGFDGTLLKANRKMCAMLGYDEGELQGLKFTAITHPEDIRASEALMRRLLGGKGAGAAAIEKRYIRKDGRIVWATVSAAVVHDIHGAAQYMVVTVQDITERKLAEERLEYHAYHDSLTGLPNRALFYDRLAQDLTHARRHGRQAGVMVLNLHRFKSVNDTLGHRIGDQLLQQAAKRLALCVRLGDTVARVGGDEFAVVLAELGAADDAGVVARRIVQSMGEPFSIEGHEVFAGASIGIALCPGDGIEPAELMKNADAAMYQARQDAGNSLRFYTAEMNRRAMEKLLLENDLRKALVRGEFRLHYQAKATLAEGRIAGFEALLRWEHPTRGLIAPCDFIPMLEESGLILEVGDWVIASACAQIRSWIADGKVSVPVAINLSARQFLQHDICQTISRALELYRVDGGLLEVEITETDAMKDPARAAAILERLQSFNVRIAIDDFGTGYSSLGYLKRFPVDLIKLDRSFVSGLPADVDDVAITRAVIGMAHSLGMKVVAEGVESEAQRRFLAAMGCDLYQGYLLSPAVPEAQAAALLDGQQPVLLPGEVAL